MILLENNTNHIYGSIFKFPPKNLIELKGRGCKWKESMVQIVSPSLGPLP